MSEELVAALADLRGWPGLDDGWRPSWAVCGPSYRDQDDFPIPLRFLRERVERTAAAR